MDATKLVASQEDGAMSNAQSPLRHMDLKNESHMDELATRVEDVVMKEEEEEAVMTAAKLLKTEQTNAMQQQQESDDQLEREIASVRRIRDCVDGVRAALASADEQIQGVATACAEAESVVDNWTRTLQMNHNTQDNTASKMSTTTTA